MDIVIEKKKRTLPTKWLWLIGTVLTTIVLFGFVKTSNIGVKSLNKNSLVLAKVQQGDMEVKVFANGLLVPKEIRWVASSVAGRVERLLVKPGHKVKQGQLLAELENLELKRQVEEINWELEATKAEFNAFKTTLETDYLNQQAAVKTAQLQLSGAQMQLDAESTLLASGNGTVSKLAHEKAKLNLAQLKNELEVGQLKLERMKLNNQAQISARQARLNILQNRYQQAAQQVEFLSVTAAEDGVVQQVSIELGQQVTAGNNLIKMAEQSNLIAELKVPEHMVNQVQLEQLVEVDTRKNKVWGTVSRIDPAVDKGSVLVEVVFSAPLPKEARPDLSITADILVASLTDVLYIKRPVTAQGNQAGVLYKLSDEQNIADKVQVRYGVGSSQTIQLLSGLNAGEQVIVSDHSQFQHIQQVRIN